MTTIPDHANTPDSAPGATPHGYANHKSDHLARLHKVEGQVCGVTRMVDDDRYCIDILTQIGAVTRALQEVGFGLLDDHVRHCVTQAARSDPDQAEEKFNELTIALHRTLRL
jgi:DNA-binding FrmR family transcriptional regulator